MTLKQAKGYIEDSNWREYKSLGGSLDRKSYEEVAAMFIVKTFDAFVIGDGSRAQATAEYTDWLAGHYPHERVGIIFRSIDNVHAYT